MASTIKRTPWQLKSKSQFIQPGPSVAAAVVKDSAGDSGKGVGREEGMEAGGPSNASGKVVLSPEEEAAKEAELDVCVNQLRVLLMVRGWGVSGLLPCAQSRGQISGS